jgi:hypothetical protein
MASAPRRGSITVMAWVIGPAETRAGTVELKVPKLQKGSYFPVPK